MYTEEMSLKQILETFKKEKLSIKDSEIINDKLKEPSVNFQFIKKLWNKDCVKCDKVKTCGTYYSYGEKEIKNKNCELKKKAISFDKVLVKKYGW